MRLATLYLIVLWLLLWPLTKLSAQTTTTPSETAPADTMLPVSGFLIDTVYFRFDSDDLQDEFKVALDSMIGIFTEYPAYYVEIFGHTDSVGSTGYNLDLSENRARNVVLYLVDQGVELERIVYEGLGTEKPVASNLTYAGRRKNRRADVAVVFSNEQVAPVYDTGPKVAEVDSSELNKGPEIIIDTVQADADPFFINTMHQTVVLAPQGTRLTIPPGVFDTDEEEVQITIGEIFSRRDMIVASMATVSRDGTLETAGMFSFDARVKGRPAKVNEGASFAVALPTTRRYGKMSIYQGRASRSKRRGRRGRGKKKPELPGGKPNMGSVQEWREVEEPVLRYNGRDDVYLFSVEAPGNYAVARPLHEATITDREDEGLDVIVKLKGKLYPETLNVMLVGEVVRTSIPMRVQAKRYYEALKTKFLADETKLVLVAYEFDDRGRAYWTKLTFKPGDFVNRKARANPRKRPQIKLKLKMRRIEVEELNERLIELNV